MKIKTLWRGWRQKQMDKFELSLRFSKIQIISLKMDISRWKIEVIICDFGFSNY